MHAAVIDFMQVVIDRHELHAVPVRVLDIGGRKVSTEAHYTGLQPHDLFWAAEVYHVLDLVDAPDVDIVADATRDVGIYNAYDVVVCTEVLEHVKDWIQILATAYEALRPEGLLILTCAGPGRRPHPGGNENLNPAPGEFYANVDHLELRKALEFIGFRNILTQQIGNDTQATAVK